MTKPTAFLEYSREEMKKRPVAERIRDFAEIEIQLSPAQIERQAARCMECGVPFCHATGCPLRNVIPEWSDLIFHKQWRRALDMLHATSNFPEFTGRVCPALCEAACTLSLNSQAVTIRQLELHLVEMGFREGWVTPQQAPVPSGKRVAIVGSGPAGLAAAQQLARAGHSVLVYESADRIGGFLRYGIPDFKLDKRVIDRRLEQLRGEGVKFETDVRVGEDISINYLKRTFAAILLAGGAREPRELEIPGRELKGIHQAADYLTQQNRRVAGDEIPPDSSIWAAGKRVVVIGGGDTGSDCVGTAVRQGAASVLQLELLPRPPVSRDVSTPWPQWPKMLRTSSSHEEGGERRWAVQTREFKGAGGRVTGLVCAEVEWKRDPATGRETFTEKPDSVFEVKADLVLLAMGFIRKAGAGILSLFGIGVPPEDAVESDERFATIIPGVYVAGDLGLGPSLVCKAIADGREAAAFIDKQLRKK
ncbi:MAG: glutamate synthase subunit beta [Myxococcota bacterium]